MVRVRMPAIRPTVTYAIIAVTVLVYALQEATNAGFLRGPFLAMGQAIFGETLLQQLLNNGWDLLVLLGGKISPLITGGQYWRLFTPLLLHASLVHIGFNMYALFAFGQAVERYYGHGRYLALYLLGGLGGNVLSYLMTPSATPSVGASTAIFGLIAAEGVFLYQNRQVFGPQARANLSNIVVVAVINLILGLSPGIDNWGHLGGLIAGLAFGWFAGPRVQVTYNYPEYELVDTRGSGQAWLVGFVIAAVLIGIVFLRVSMG